MWEKISYIFCRDKTRNLILILTGFILVWHSAAIAGGGFYGGSLEYWYDGQNKIPLSDALIEALMDTADTGNESRSSEAIMQEYGLSRFPASRFYICYPSSWPEERITDLENRYDLKPLDNPAPPGILYYKAVSPVKALTAANRIMEEEEVNCAAPVWRKKMKLRQFESGDPLFDLQWHLENTGQNGALTGNDINIAGVWDQYTGRDITIGIVDDGLELTHPDLEANSRPDLSSDFLRENANPSGGEHGTAVAGIAAAVGFNGIGVRGVAPAAGLASLRLIADDLAALDDQEVQAVNHNLDDIHILNNSWGPPDGEEGAFNGLSPLLKAAYEQAVKNGREGKGRIFTRSSGNGGYADSSNLDGYANSRFSLAVSATNSEGRAAGFAERGANILLNAPTGDFMPLVTTTDLTGESGFNNGVHPDLPNADYTSLFQGTSASAPQAAGTAALLLAINPTLTWRDVGQILSLSAEQNDPAHPSWQINNAGSEVSEFYGFGRLDVKTAVNLAGIWQNMAPEAATSLQQKSPARIIPDNNPAGAESTISISERLRIEYVEVTVNIPDHTWWGDLAFYLTSPAGTEVLLSPSVVISSLAASNKGYFNWTFGDVLHGGELSRGSWTLKVVDQLAEDEGTLQDWSIRIYGSPLPAAADLPKQCSSLEVIGGQQADSIVGLGLNRHGAPFEQSVTGSHLEDFGVVLAVETGSSQPVEYLAVADCQSGNEQLTGTFMRTPAGWVEWNEKIENLQGIPNQMPGSVVSLLQQRLSPMDCRIYGGYRNSAEEVVYCPDPLHLMIR